jgi:hypothetical protein
MLFRNAIPLRSVSPYSLNVGLKALTKLLSAVIASSLVVNKGMMHCDVGSSRLEVSTVFHPKHTSASIHYDSLVPARRVLVTTILRLLKQRSSYSKNTHE